MLFKSFLLLLLFILCVRCFACTFVCASSVYNVQGGQKRTSDPLRLESQTFELMWVLRIKSGFFVKATSSLKTSASSLLPQDSYGEWGSLFLTLLPCVFRGIVVAYKWLSFHLDSILNLKSLEFKSLTLVSLRAMRIIWLKPWKRTYHLAKYKLLKLPEGT